LPGSVALNKSTSEVDITLTYKVTFNFVNVTNDISCKAYDGENAERQLCSNSTTHNSPNHTIQKSPNPTTQNNPNPTTHNITPKPGKLGSSEDGNPCDKGKNAYYARSY
jgi:hypothetical protein